MRKPILIMVTIMCVHFLKSSLQYPYDQALDGGDDVDWEAMEQYRISEERSMYSYNWDEAMKCTTDEECNRILLSNEWITGVCTIGVCDFVLVDETYPGINFDWFETKWGCYIGDRECNKRGVLYQ